MFKVLIVENMKSFRKSLREILDSNFPSIVVEEAGNGKEALEKADSFCPDLVFMDIRLPDESGLELTKKIKAQYPKVAVVMFTGHDIPEYREAATVIVWTPETKSLLPFLYKGRNHPLWLSFPCHTGRQGGPFEEIF